LCGGLAISYIIIDGYNVTGIFHKDLEKAREALLSSLAEYKKIMPHDITVVFDSYKTGMATEQVSYYGGVRVIFTRLGERADDVIKQTVSKERREWLVVTADREIVDHAWANGSAAVPPDKFMDIVSGRRRKGADDILSDDEADEESDKMRSRRGNPYKLSKKDKMLKKVLGKL
jgi:uncharacterized protein